LPIFLFLVCNSSQLLLRGLGWIENSSPSCTHDQPFSHHI
jgi:hypothetical protein